MKKYCCTILLCALLVSAFSGCASAAGTSQVSGTSSTSSVTSSSTASPAEGTPAAASQETTSQDTSSLFSERDQNPEYEESEAIPITLNGASASCDGGGVTIDGAVITITQGGVYVLSGKLTNGQVIVDAQNTDKVQLVLSDASIHCDTSAAIYVRQADKVFLTLKTGTENSLSNQSDFVAIDDNNIDGVVFSKDDLTCNGGGSLVINALYGHGIVGKDELTITGGTYEINAAQHALSGKDCINVSGGSFTLTAGTDGLHSENKDDLTLGSIAVTGGDFTIVSGGDGLDAATTCTLESGTFSLTTGGGSTAELGETSGKGVKSAGDLRISGGSFTIDSADDALHTNGNLDVTGGDFTISSGDDGIHADATLTVSEGKINITQSYEGLEALHLLIAGGDISLVASDDGLNAAGGNDGSSLGGRPGMNGFASAENGSLEITGGKLNIDAQGDGLDSNGTLTISGGEVTLSGPTSGMDSALDYDGTGIITGGTVVAVSSQGMAQGFGTDSSQCWILTSIEGSGQITLADSTGKTLLSYTPSREYGCVILSSPELKQGETYTITAGSETKTVTLESTSYSDVAGGMGGMGGGGGRGGMGGMGGTPPEMDANAAPPDMTAPV